MPEDYYSDGGGMTATDSTPKGTDDASGDEHKEGETKKYTLPAEICPGMKPGDVMELHIEAVHDGQYTVFYEPEKKGEGEKGMSEEAPAGGGGGGDSEMQSMME